MATRLSEGDVTKLNYANQISNMVNTLIVGNLLIYFYPKIVNAIEKKLGQGYFWDRTYFFHALICLVIVGYAAVGKEGVALLFQRGKFTEDATTTVFYLSLIYIAGQQINVIRDSIYRFFYANNDTKSTTINSIITTGIHVVLSIVLVKLVGLFGVVLASVTSSLVSLITIIIKMKKKYGIEESIAKIVFQYAKTIFITLVTGVIVIALKSLLNLSNTIVVVLVFGCATVIVYLGLTLLLNRKILRNPLSK
jgi:peptidoglycan biosynthesis protein MviN/MurJ (putative lipid II flippase)